MGCAEQGAVDEVEVPCLAAGPTHVTSVGKIEPSAEASGKCHLPFPPTQCALTRPAGDRRDKKGCSGERQCRHARRLAAHSTAAGDAFLAMAPIQPHALSAYRASSPAPWTSTTTSGSRAGTSRTGQVLSDGLSQQPTQECPPPHAHFCALLTVAVHAKGRVIAKRSGP
jgi:hypothetical protein